MKSVIIAALMAVMAGGARAEEKSKYDYNFPLSRLIPTNQVAACVIDKLSGVEREALRKHINALLSRAANAAAAFETQHAAAKRVRESAAAAFETQHAKAVYAESQWSAWKQEALDWQAYAEQVEAQPQEDVYVEDYRLEARIEEAESEAQRARLELNTAQNELMNIRLNAAREARMTRSLSINDGLMMGEEF